MAVIYVTYTDVGEQKHTYGGETFTQQRCVKNIEPIEGGYSGTITYKRRIITVYRPLYQLGVEIWYTDINRLKPPKATYL